MESKDYKKFNDPIKPSNNDEIDLSLLFSKVMNGIAYAGKQLALFIFLVIDRILKNFKLLILATLIGGILGVGYFFAREPYYHSDMTISSAYHNGAFLTNSINTLDRLCKEGNYPVLAQMLKIPTAKARTIRRLEVEKTMSPNLQLLIDIYKEKEGGQHAIDSLILFHNDSTFHINAQVYDTTTFFGLDTVLVNYIKNNKFINRRIAIERRNLLARKIKLERESRNLDTLKNYMARSYLNQKSGPANPAGTQVTLNSKDVNPIEVYREDFRLYDQQLKIDKVLNTNSEIEIIEPFTPFKEPASGTLLKNSLKGALVGLLVGLLYIFFKILELGISKLRTNLGE
ncbi:hypothetical protein [Adhaeribacter aquaticus]|uniref:hypothetical protein n=1 Tax=Adhaeribacter aquaticus TaxID=299567 RepID=UPI00040E058C|nr:hypothetical protein [Adhaeribacter aquaticus]